MAMDMEQLVKDRYVVAADGEQIIVWNGSSTFEVFTASNYSLIYDREIRWVSCYCFTREVKNAFEAKRAAEQYFREEREYANECIKEASEAQTSAAEYRAMEHRDSGDDLGDDDY